MVRRAIGSGSVRGTGGVLGVAVLAMTAASVAWAGPRRVNDLPAAVGATPCAVEILARLGLMAADLQDARRDVPGSDGRQTFRVPTAALGHWIHVSISAAGNTTLTAVGEAEHRVEVVRIEAPGCNPEQSTRDITLPSIDAVDAGAMSRQVGRFGATVYYIWSPHMPLSVDGYDQARAAAAARGLPFVATVDPNADPGFARRTAERRGWPADAARTFTAIELLYRGVTTHAPCLTVVGPGIPRDAIFGYRETPSYAAFIDDVLDR